MPQTTGCYPPDFICVLTKDHGDDRGTRTALMIHHISAELARSRKLAPGRVCPARHGLAPSAMRTFVPVPGQEGLRRLTRSKA
jgi:hypothetical protein